MKHHRSLKAGRWFAAACAVGLGGGALTATAAGSSEPATVTEGPLVPFAAGTGGSICGHAHMVRNASGSTIVSLHVGGLTPGGTYVSHVHAAPCAVGAADGHVELLPIDDMRDMQRWSAFATSPNWAFTPRRN